MSHQISSSLEESLSPAPLINAVERYQGTITDLDRSIVVGPDEFAAGRTSLASEFVERGLEPGDRVVLSIGNGPLFPAALSSILESGGSPLLVHYETPVAELRRLAFSVGARFIACDDVGRESSLRSAGFRTSVVCDSWTRTLWSELDSQDAEFQPTSRGLVGVPLHPTSGSTGRSKIAARPGPCAMAEAQHYVDTLELGSDDVIAAVPPMSHAYGFGMCTMVPMLTGASLVTMRRFGAGLVERAIREGNATVLPLVPAMLDVLIHDAGDGLTGFRGHVLSAGAPLPERTAHEFRRRTGVVVRPLYGTTETGGISIATVSEGAVGACVGRPMNGVSVDIQPLPGGSHLGSGVGRVRVRSSSMMLGYVDNDELSTEALQDDWFVTGDLGKCDATGAIHLVGRESDVINVGGLKVVPGDVESVLRDIPGVLDLKVYAGRRRNGSQFVKAAIYAPGLEPGAINSWCEEQLVYYKRPEEIIILDQPLPRTASGKIVKANLP